MGNNDSFTLWMAFGMGLSATILLTLIQYAKYNEEVEIFEEVKEKVELCESIGAEPEISGVGI